MRLANPLSLRVMRLGDMIVGAVSLLSDFALSTRVDLVRRLADAAALTLGASASWRLTPETASFAELASSVVEATCGGEEVTLGR